jgi:solute carrier family 44 (choline transporter-like protein), member 2/4/5
MFFLSQQAEDVVDLQTLKARHHCTDLPFCILFVATFLAFGSLYGHGLANGDIRKIFHGIDYHGQVCGVDIPDRPFLYWCMAPVSMTDGNLNLNLERPICVPSCPGTHSEFGQQVPVMPECAQVSGFQGLVTYKTMVLFDRFCVPDSDIYKNAAGQVYQGLSSFKLLVKLSSLYAARPILLGTCVLAIFLSYVYLMLLRYFTKPLFWVTMTSVTVSLTCLGAYCWVHAGYLSQQLPPNVHPPPGYGAQEKITTQAFAMLLWGLALLSLCIVLCYGRSISAAAACIELACDAIFEMPSLLFAPLIKAVAKACTFFLLCYGFLVYLSTADLSAQIHQGTLNGVFRQFNLSYAQMMALLFYVFAAFWIQYFLSALYEFIVAYAVAEYYYAGKDRKEIGFCSIFDGFQVGIVFHSGSLALGSIMVAGFGVLRFLVDALEAEHHALCDNKLLRCILSCVLCFVHCIKCIVQLITKNAYIDMVLTSSSYCVAAREAVVMIAEMGGSMIILTGASWVFSIFGSFLVAVCCAVFSLMMTGTQTFQAADSPLEIASPAIAAVGSGLIGMSVAWCFMMVFDMTSDSLLYCYGLDMRDRRPSSHAPQALKDLYQKHNSDDKGSHR